ncbi:MAG TPA: HEAT repeat domain-containing protein [Terriglobales bacterium]|nr:HEAT repeat domain-containing protein [Terriglobales bacterium]
MHSSSIAATVLICFCGVLPAAGQSSAAVHRSSAGARSEINSPTQRAWELLDKGVASHSADIRAMTVGALGVVINNRHVIRIAEKSLRDSNPLVRAAAATALGKMHARASVPRLLAALDDKEPEVVLAAAKSLISLHNGRGYEVYYEVLTGQRKGGKNAVEQELGVLRNPKKLAEMGFEEGIGFVPFGSMGLEAYRVLRGGSEMGVRAAAATILAHDPDPGAATALADAAGDPNWHVRVAAIDAIAERGDRRLLSAVLPGLEDEKQAVRYAAAAAVLRLSTAKRHTKSMPLTTASLGH